jgi:hypothetical protein
MKVPEELDNVAALFVWHKRCNWNKDTKEWSPGWYFKKIYKNLGVARGQVTRLQRGTKWQLWQVAIGHGWSIREEGVR